MAITRKIKLLLPVFISSAMGACSSTEVIDQPESPNTDNNVISIHMAGIDNGITRATTDHKLRYVAKLLKNFYPTSSVAGEDPVYIERKEVIASGSDVTLTFDVEEGKYTILLFADYIPADSSIDDNGCYTDNYYDTSNTTSQPQMISLKKIDLNNDNMDCFSGKIAVTKGSDKVDETVTLKRMVSKIRFVSATPLPENASISGITVSKLSYFSQLDMSGGDNSVSIPDAKTDLSSDKLNSDSSDENGQELFFFYTLSNTSLKDLLYLGEIKFKVNYTSDYEGTSVFTINSGTIPAKRNTITTAKGAFLSPATPEKGAITLHLSSENAWGEETITEIK